MIGPFGPVTWTCEICNQQRPDDAISVHQVDFSASLNLPRGHCMRNIKYCNDKPDCYQGAIEKGKDA